MGRNLSEKGIKEIVDKGGDAIASAGRVRGVSTLLRFYIQRFVQTTWKLVGFSEAI